MPKYRKVTSGTTSYLEEIPAWEQDFEGNELDDWSDVYDGFEPYEIIALAEEYPAATPDELKEMALAARENDSD